VYRFCLGFIGLASLPLSGQVADTLLPITVVDSLRIKGSLNAQTIDPSFLAIRPLQNPASTLGFTDQAYVRASYPGGLATLSLRGATSQQTMVVWNGLPLNSPMNGTLDLNLLYNAGNENLRVITGPGAAVLGSGAVSGALELTSGEPATKGFSGQVSLQGGSFGHLRMGGQFLWKNKRIWGSLGLAQVQTQNNYPIPKTLFQPQSTQTNAEVRQSLWSLSLGTAKKGIWNWNLHLWNGMADRGIPPTRYERNSAARQTDVNFRVSGQLTRQTKSSASSLRLGGFSETNLYSDVPRNIDAKNQSELVMVDLEHQWEVLPKFNALVGYQFLFQSGNGEGYDQQTRTTHALLARATWKPGPWHFAAGIRPTHVQQWGSIPWIWDATAGWQSKGWTTQLSVGKVFRLPTLNDLFWIPGGQPLLNPENGVMAEWNTTYLWRSMGQNPLQIKPSLGIFTRQLQQTILWRPSANPAIWEPQNLGQTQAWGGDLWLRSTYTLNQWTSKLDVGYVYTQSRDLNNQPLPYLPQHKVSGRMFAGYGGWWTEAATQVALGFSDQWLDLGEIQLLAGYTGHFNDLEWMLHGQFTWQQALYGVHPLSFSGIYLPGQQWLLGLTLKW
jgi:iron complex outermembrane receptor protein